jgi:FlaA1/EpsC-like NDP-sugar epimerase
VPVLWIDLLLQPRPLPLSVILLGNVLALMGFISIRYRSRLISGMSWRWKAVWRGQFPKPQTTVLVVGAGEAGQSLVWRLKHRSPNQSYAVVGFVDDDASKQGLYIEGCRVLGVHTQIPRLVELHNVDLIIVAIHNISGHKFREILTYCEVTNARIKIVPDLFQLMNGNNPASILRDVQPEDLIGRSPITHHEALDKTPLVGKIIMVTGAAGSIGSELSRQISFYNPAKVILLDNNESGLHDLLIELNAEFPQGQFVPVLADIGVKDALCPAMELHRPEVIFHAAAYKHVPLLESHPREAVRVNVRGLRNIAELAGENGAERFVFISTDKAVNPSSVMGASKRIGELYLHSLSQQRKYSTLFASVRFGNVLGSRGSVVPIFNHQIDSGGPVTVTHPDMTRYFMSISEAANLVIQAACLTRGDDIYLLRMGEVVRIVELAERMIRMRGLRPYVDIEIRFTGIRPGEKMHEELYDANEIPEETVHPHIIELKNGRNHTDPSSFLEKLDGLINETLNGNELGRLLELLETGQVQP